MKNHKPTTTYQKLSIHYSQIFLLCKYVQGGAIVFTPYTVQLYSKWDENWWKLYYPTLYISKYCNLVSNFLPTLTRFVTKILITFSRPKILEILKQIFLKPILKNISCETKVSEKLLLLWVAFMTFPLKFWPIRCFKFV